MKPKPFFLLLPLLASLVSAEPFIPRKPVDPMWPTPSKKLQEEKYHKYPPTKSTSIIEFPLSQRLLSESGADEICLSGAFTPTIENWWESGATEWIKSYTLANAGNPRFKELGLIDHLAEVYLKKTNFKCGIDTPHRCAVECQEVVTRVEDLEDARVVWFVLKSAGHIAEVTKVVHVSSYFFFLIYQSFRGKRAPWEETGSSSTRERLHPILISNHSPIQTDQKTRTPLLPHK